MATIMDACAALQKRKKVTKNGHEVILNTDGEMCLEPGVPIVPSIGTMINYLIDEQLKLEPNQWCTGQEWVDTGGSWNDFKEAHKADKTAEYLSFSSSWGKVVVPLRYDNSKCKYRLKLDDKAELPKKREVPLINPLRIPIDWWGIAKDDGSDKLWFMYATQPRIGINVWDQNEGLFSLLGISPLRISTKWEGNWKNSAFTRAKIQARWEEEYGSEWCNKALEDLDAKSN